MKILITENQYDRILMNEDLSSSKDCKTFVETKEDPKYKRYLIEYKVYMDGFKLANKQWPNRVSSLKDYDFFSTGFIDGRPWFSYKESVGEYFKYYSPLGPKSYYDEVRRMVKDNIRKYGIEPASLAFQDEQFPAYKKPKKVCIKPPVVNKTPIVSATPVNNVVTNTITKPNPPEPIKTNFSVTFGQDGKQQTIYFKTFNEWKKFDDSVRGKWGYMHSNYNQAESEGSTLLKGTPEDWTQFLPKQ